MNNILVAGALSLLGLLAILGINTFDVQSPSRTTQTAVLGETAQPTVKSKSTVVPAAAGTRSFLMALFDSPTGKDADLPIFREGDPQPAGKSIMHVLNWNSTSFGFTLASEGYDLSRVSAFLIDEPFWPGDGIETNPCVDPAGKRFGWLKEASVNLPAAAATLKYRAPSARVWVNYSVEEIHWMQDGTCTPYFSMNGPFIDVVSIDYYFVDFATSVRPLYEWLIAHPGKTGQQIALIPGTGIRVGVDDQSRIAGLIPAFFSYADEKNATCMDLNKCLVWLVGGWPAINYPASPPNSPNAWVGELDPSMTAIKSVWRAKLGATIALPPPNKAPATPTVSGPKSGIVGQKLSFTVNATDPDGDQVRYGNNGGNGNSILYWSGYVPSGTSVALPDWVWSTAGDQKIVVQVQDAKGASSAAVTYPVAITGIPNKTPSAPTVTGPTTGYINTPYSFVLSATDPDNDQIRYGNNGGSGAAIIYWSNYVPSGTSVPLPDWVWKTPGPQTIVVQTQDSKGATSATTAYTITLSNPVPTNKAPSAPTISGPTTGTVGQKLSFVLNATDPDGDQIRYGNNGGTGDTILYWSGYVPSGTSVPLPDWVWSTPGDQKVVVQVQDSKGASSVPVTYLVKIQ